ncbi:hypothetical protein EJ08DRAFT_653685 [Tothia fuscella]|uniref:NAD-dependent epimerase/dehydratase domain-containing protein n=1 Tax=Tothia fuscella TaxID=1048955 RepID=A0A9P4NGX8_9PEZI|nr:hypothetical protein EJ08DRAFT_653685 [Tothia fuscella]
MAAKSDPLTIKNAAIPKESWVLVTGINGLIGSHVGDQLLRVSHRLLAAMDLGLLLRRKRP